MTTTNLFLKLLLLLLLLLLLTNTLKYLQIYLFLLSPIMLLSNFSKTFRQTFVFYLTQIQPSGFFKPLAGCLKKIWNSSRKFVVSLIVKTLTFISLDVRERNTVAATYILSSGMS